MTIKGMRTRLWSDERGTTLIELMVVIGILGIMMAISVPAIAPQIGNAELNQGAREVVSVLRRARAQAVNEQVPRYVDLSVPNQLTVYRCAPNANFTDCTWTQDGNAITLPRSIRLSYASGQFPALANTPPGTATADSVPAGAIYFGTSGGYEYLSGTTGVSYTLTVSSTRRSTTRVLAIARNTGHVTLTVP